MEFILRRYIIFCILQVMWNVSFSQRDNDFTSSSFSDSNITKHLFKIIHDSLLNVNLVRILDSVLYKDQVYRVDEINIIRKYGYDSEEIIDLKNKTRKNDIINIAIINRLIEEYGWLGIDKVGTTGLSTIFLVIQHSDLSTQERYLPIIRKAAKEGKFPAPDLAFLEDRIAIQHGEKQIYGSQVSLNYSTGEYFILPIFDEINVNKRRLSVGLKPLNEYVKNFDIDYKLPSSNDRSSSITSKTVYVLLIVIFLLFLTIEAILFKKMKFKVWYWFYTILVLFFFYNTYIDINSVYSLLKIYQINWFLYSFSELILNCFIVYFFNFMFVKAFKKNIVFINIFSILLGMSSCFLLFKYFLQKIFLPSCDIIFYFNFIEIIFYITIFSILHFVLFLIKRYRKRQL